MWKTQFGLVEVVAGDAAAAPSRRGMREREEGWKDGVEREVGASEGLRQTVRFASEERV